MRRVVVTGIGVLNAIGKNRTEFEQSLREGRCGIIPLTDPAHREFRFSNAAEVPNFNAADHFSLKEADMIDRFAQFAVVAAREAVAHSGIEWTSDLRENSAIVTGSCIGGQTTEDQGFFDVYKMGKPRVHPMTIPKTMANGGASAISLEFGITGPTFTIATACSSSAHAIGQAFHMVRSGMCDVAIAGGIHIAALGGIWQMAVFGFAGVSLLDDGIAVDPQLPVSWHSLRFPLQWRGRHLNIKIDQVEQWLEVTLEVGTPMKLVVNGEQHELRSGLPLRLLTKSY